MPGSNRPLNSDPLRNFRFNVSINAGNFPGLSTLVNLGFMAVSGISVSNEVIPYREGGNNTTTRKMPGQSDFGPIVFTRGMAAAPLGSSGGTQEIYNWFTTIFSVNAGQGFGGATLNFRFGVTVDVMAHPITTGQYSAGLIGSTSKPPIVARIQIYNAWPMGYSLSDLEAGGNAVFVENLTLAHEGFNLAVMPNDGKSFINGALQV
jgi:phage tail-like protein